MTLNNTHTTTQKLTNNGFHNTKKHPEKGLSIPGLDMTKMIKFLPNKLLKKDAYVAFPVTAPTAAGL